MDQSGVVESDYARTWWLAVRPGNEVITLLSRSQTVWERDNLVYVYIYTYTFDDGVIVGFQGPLGSYVHAQIKRGINGLCRSISPRSPSLTRMDYKYAEAILSVSLLAYCAAQLPYEYPEVDASDPRTPLHFGLLQSFGGGYDGSGVIPGIDVALDQINADPYMLPGYTILTDSQVDIYLYGCMWVDMYF